VDPPWLNADSTASFEPINHLPDTLVLVAVKRLNHERGLHRIPARPGVAQCPADASKQPQDVGALLGQRSSRSAGRHYAPVASAAEGVVQVQGQLRGHKSATAIRSIVDTMEFLGAWAMLCMPLLACQRAVHVEDAQAGGIMTTVRACMGGPATREAAITMPAAMQGCLEIFEAGRRIQSCIPLRMLENALGHSPMHLFVALLRRQCRAAAIYANAVLALIF